MNQYVEPKLTLEQTDLVISLLQRELDRLASAKEANTDELRVTLSKMFHAREFKKFCDTKRNDGA
jgi:hypothetical protein